MEKEASAPKLSKARVHVDKSLESENCFSRFSEVNAISGAFIFAISVLSLSVPRLPPFCKVCIENFKQFGATLLPRFLEVTLDCDSINSIN